MSDPIPSQNKTVEFPLAGITKSGYDRDILYEGMRVVLIPDFTNQYDSNAIKVCDSDQKQIAFIPRKIAEVVAKRIRTRQYSYTARLILVPEGDLTVWGVHLELIYMVKESVEETA